MGGGCESRRRLKDQDVEKLWRLFQGSFDQSRVLSFLEDGCEAGQRLGQGTHFEVFSLPRTSEAMPLVLKRMRDSGWRRQELLSWVEALGQLRRRRLALVPPFVTLFARDESFCMVMPRGEPLMDDATVLVRHWQDLPAAIADLKQSLSAAKLVIADALQLSHYEGIPFVHDLSDLKWSDQKLAEL